jgi:hypothetical protein
MPNEQLDLLQEEIEKLKGIIDRLQEREREDLKVRFDSTRNLVLDGIWTLYEIYKEYNNLKDSYHSADEHARSIDINNPTSKTTGIDVFTKILEAAKSSFLLRSDADETKKRTFSEILQKIAQHPVTRTAFAATPATAVVGNIITAASVFWETKIKTNVEIGKKTSPVDVLKGLSTSYEGVINDNAINEFKNKIKVYITFYEELSTLNTAHKIKLEEWYNEFNANGFIESIEIYVQLLKILQIDENKSHKEAFNEFSNKFIAEQNTTVDNLRKLLNDKKINDAIQLIGKSKLHIKLDNLIKCKSKLRELETDLNERTQKAADDFNKSSKDDSIAESFFTKLDKRRSEIAQAFSNTLNSPPSDLA